MNKELQMEYLLQQAERHNQEADISILAPAIAVSLIAGLVGYHAANTLGLGPETSQNLAEVITISGLGVSGAVYRIAETLNYLEISEDIDRRRD